MQIRRFYQERKLRILTLYPSFHSIYFFVPFCIFSATTIPFISVYFFPSTFGIYTLFSPARPRGAAFQCVIIFAAAHKPPVFLFYFVFVLFYFCREVSNRFIPRFFISAFFPRFFGRNRPFRPRYGAN